MECGPVHLFEAQFGCLVRIYSFKSFVDHLPECVRVFAHAAKKKKIPRAKPTKLKVKLDFLSTPAITLKYHRSITWPLTKKLFPVRPVKYSKQNKLWLLRFSVLQHYILKKEVSCALFMIWIQIKNPALRIKEMENPWKYKYSGNAGRGC